MKYIELFEKIDSPVFSLQDLKISGIFILPYQISKLNKAGYIKKIKNGLYAFTNKKEIVTPEYLAYKIYQPSYISLESALYHYGLMPEMVYNVTSISTKTTRKFKNDFGIFIYRNIKKELFWGYKKEEKKGQIYQIAEPEKALLDYIYFNLFKIKDDFDIKELRLNPILLKQLNIKKLKEYTKIFDNKKITKIILKIIQ